MFNRVREFHRAFDQLIADHPSLPSQDVRDLRCKLLLEELDEFCTAFEANDPIEMADGLGDIAVIICGTMISYGIVPGNGDFDSPYSDGTPPFLDAAATHTFPDILTTTFSLYLAAEEDNDLNQIKELLMEMLMDVCGIAVNLSIPLNAVFAEVHRSNMSKLMPDGSVRRRDDGKVLKSPNWSPPDIAGVLSVNT